MAKILRYDNSCQIINEDDSDFILKVLDNELSFTIQGAEFSKAFKGYTNERGEQITWDGKKHLLSGDLRFPVGLLDRVINIYTKHKKPLEIEDCRRNVSKPEPIDILEKLKLQGKTPRQYQLDAVDTAVKYNRGIVRMATGAGKTVCMALLTARLGKSTIIYVIGKDLLYQIHDLFSSLFDEEIGFIGDGKCEIKRINIVSVWSVGKVFGIKDLTTDDDDSKEQEISKEKYRAIKEMLLNTQTHIIDECHLAACETIQTISHNVKAEYFYGFSASPWRDDNSDLLIEAVLGHRIVDISAKYLIERGFLVNPIIRFLPVTPYQGKKSSHYKTIYKNYITMNNNRNNMVLKAATKMVEQGFKPLVLFKNKAHGKILFKLLSEHLKCGLLSGDNNQKTRDMVKGQIENGEIDCIIASTIFDIGLDLPILSGLIIASGGKSSVRALQRVGRVIRLHKDKRKAVVIDFCDQAPYLRDHSETRRDILLQEFDVSWPEEK